MRFIDDSGSECCRSVGGFGDCEICKKGASAPSSRRALSGIDLRFSSFAVTFVVFAGERKAGEYTRG